MIIGAFGDSFLFGSDLSDIQNFDALHWFIPSNNTYPALIAQQLQLQYYCTALPGQGNKVISDDVIRTVVQRGSDAFYFINWSWIDRFEYLGTAKVGDAIGWESTLPGDNNNNSNYYYKNFYTDIDAKLSNLMYINTALECLLANKCKFIMTYMDHLLFDTEYNTSVSIEYLQNKIKSHCTNFNGMNFLEWSRANQFPESNHWHPLEQAHKAAADYWLPKVHTLLNSSAKEESNAFK